MDSRPLAPERPRPAVWPAHIAAGALPSGLPGLDRALGTGGYPRGQLVELFGAEASGKTSIALEAAAAVQREGGAAAYLDAEHALEPGHARRLGVDTEALIALSPESGEQAFAMAGILLESGAIDLLIIDSVAALAPERELAQGLGEAAAEEHSRLLSRYLRRLRVLAVRKNCCVLLVNQVRSSFASGAAVSTGGNSMKLHAAVSLGLERGPAILEDRAQAGFRARLTVLKNRFAAPFGRAEFGVYHAGGSLRAGHLIELGLEHRLIERRESTYWFDKAPLAEGRAACAAALDADPDLGERLEARLRAAMGLPERPKPAPRSASAPPKLQGPPGSANPLVRWARALLLWR